MNVSESTGPQGARSTLLAVAAIVGVTVVFFWEPIFAGRVLLLRDIHSLFHPWTAFSVDHLRDGVVPLWNHFSYAGQPYAANPQVQMFYPPQAIFLLLPFAVALSVYIIGHTLLLGLGGYWMMRRFGFSQWAGILTALVLMFNGWTVRSHEFLTQFASLSWNPILLTLWWRVIERRKTTDLLALGTIVGLQTLAGHPQRQVYTILMMLVVWTFHIATALLHRRRTRELLLQIAWPTLGLLLAAAISAVQVVPLLELWRHMHRTAAPELAATPVQFSLWPSELVNFVVPYFYGYPDWQKACYVGLATIPCAIWGAFSLRHGKHKGPGLVVVCIAWLTMAMFLSFGQLNPVLRIVPLSVPFWGEFMRWPTAAFMIATFAFAVLAGAGIDVLMQTKHRWMTVAILIAIASLVVITVADAISGFEASDALRSPSHHAYLIYPPNPTILYTNFPVMPRYIQLWVLAAGTATAILLRSKLGRVFPVCWIALIAVDLFLFNHKQDFYSPENIYEEKPAVIEKLTQTTLKDRLDITPSGAESNSFLYGNRDLAHFRHLRETLIEEIALPYRIFRFYGWRSLELGSWRRMYKIMTGDADELLRWRLYLAMNVGMRIGPEKRPNPDIPMPLSKLESYESDIGKRISAVPGVRVVEDEAEAEGLIVLPSFNIDRELILSEGENRPPTEDFNCHIGNAVYTAGLLRFKVAATGPGHLLIATYYYPGWQAYVNGKQTTVLRANLDMSAVPIPEGEYPVDLVYRPASFLAGLWITVIGLGTLALFRVHCCVNKLQMKKANRKGR